VHGFRVAAELLAQHVASYGTEQDGLIFPFLYNWRQHIELALKEIILEAESLLDEEEQPFPQGHNLDLLWRRCRKALEHVEPHAEVKPLDNAGRVIAELHAMDPKGDGFRYPQTREGKVTLGHIENLSFGPINEALVAVSNFLEATGESVAISLDFKREMEAEFRQELEAQFADEY
jgi:hypothetical protein